jgi:methylenetetrahydrofolate--tRNA-(uracil-5-)-methyltransferase
MHRNSYIDSPRLLNGRYEVIADPRVRFAGQITGVEGYIESAASGLAAGTGIVYPKETAIGALAAYISNPANSPFRPAKIHFGLLPPLPETIRDKQEKCRRLSERAIQKLEAYICTSL